MKSNKNDTSTFRHELSLIDSIYADSEFKMPIRYVLGLTNDCNLDCPFCFLEKHKGQFRMELDDWKRIIDQLPNYARVILFGGEPLFYKHFDEIYAYLSKRFKCTVVTNGTLLTPKKIKYLLSHDGLEEIAVSIDCIGNHNRDFKDRQWTRLVNSIKLFNDMRKEMKNPPRLGISTVILDETASNLFDLHRYIHEELNCDHVTYCTLNGTAMQLSDRMQPYESLFTPEVPPLYKNWEQIVSMLEKIRSYNKEHNIQSYFRPKLIDFNQDEPISALTPLNQTQFDKERFGPCKIPWSDCRVYSDGSVTNCLGVKLGNAKTQPELSTILKGPVSTQFRKDIKEYNFFEKCSRCVFLYDCQFE